ncbi:protein kinase [Streptosporangium canum]|uniref:protein kinase domain-containing protein n=1 Tax=Streptosporangium canum TaxID=324952 RepID=UPI003420E4C3
MWQARDRETGDHVAAKLLLMDDVKRYEREIRALRLLSPSDRIAAIHDASDHDGRPYLIMGWIEGDSLQEVLRREPLPRLERVLHWTGQICEGLAHAHREGVFHRDVKPANIMVSPAGNVTLVDFGIARFVDSTFTAFPEDRAAAHRRRADSAAEHLPRSGRPRHVGGPGGAGRAHRAVG